MVSEKKHSAFSIQHSAKRTCYGSHVKSCARNGSVIGARSILLHALTGCQRAPFGQTETRPQVEIRAKEKHDSITGYSVARAKVRCLCAAPGISQEVEIPYARRKPVVYLISESKLCLDGAKVDIRRIEERGSCGSECRMRLAWRKGHSCT